MERDLHHEAPEVAADAPEGTTSDMAVGHDRRRPEIEAASDEAVIEAAADTEKPTSKKAERKSNKD